MTPSSVLDRINPPPLHPNPWGITCQNVGIKNIVIPEALSNAMSKQAQAKREGQA